MAMPPGSVAAMETDDPQFALIPAANDYLPEGSPSLAYIRYRLLAMLQTTLDLENMLNLFHQESRQTFDHCGLVYTNESQQLQLSVGSVDLHSCSYRLITQRDNLGEIVLYHDTRFCPAGLEIIESLLGTLLCPLRNALQYRIALNASMTDALTGAGNRLAMMTNLEHELNVARRYQHELSLLVIDIDKFKKINDTQGHAAGDNVLQQMVRLVKKVNRNTDLCYRYGGEEFVVILSKTDKYGAIVIAERLREAVAGIRICGESGPLHLTVSIGATSYGDGDTKEDLLSRADKAMYKIKNQGGNNSAYI